MGSPIPRVETLTEVETGTTESEGHDTSQNLLFGHDCQRFLIYNGPIYRYIASELARATCCPAASEAIEDGIGI